MELATATVKVQIDTADLARQLREVADRIAAPATETFDQFRERILASHPKRSEAGLFLLDLLDGAYAAEHPTWTQPDPGTFVLEWERLDIDKMADDDTDCPRTPMTSTITIRTKPRQ
jgi:hypothetical protein